jgi:hypothetical protein
MTDPFLDALLDLPRLLGAQVSPDGTWTAWVWHGIDATANVYAAPTDASQPPIKLTDSDQNVVLASFFAEAFEGG